MRPGTTRSYSVTMKSRRKKEENVGKTKAREEVEGDYFIKPNKEPSSIPVNPDSKRLNKFRRLNPVQKKNLQGIYESLSEGVAIVNTSGTKITIKTCGQKDMVISKSDIAIKGNKREGKEAKAAIDPRLIFLGNKEELVKRVQDNKHEIVEKMTHVILFRLMRKTSEGRKLQLRSKIQLKQTWQKCQEFGFLKRNQQ